MSPLKDGAYLDVSFQSATECTSSIRALASNYYGSQIDDDPELVERIAMAAHELVENASHYAADQHARVRIEVKRTNGTIHVSIRTWNLTDANHVRDVENLMTEMKASGDPFKFFLTAMRRTAQRKDGSGLGLARIRSEADMNVSYTFKKNMICVEASTDVQDKGKNHD
jgi:hypothetical protein